MGFFADIAKDLLAKQIAERNKKNAQRLQAEVDAKEEAGFEERQQQRQRQLDALLASAPSSPPERMRATIQLNEFRDTKSVRETIKNTFGEDTYVYHRQAANVRYAVDMVLDLPQADLGIVNQRNLGPIVLEESAAYNEVELAEAYLEGQDEIDATKGLLLKEIRKQTFDQAHRMMKSERRTTCVHHLLTRPFSRVFDDQHKAKEFSDLLKTKYLPALKRLIDQYRDHKETETLEF